MAVGVASGVIETLTVPTHPHDMDISPSLIGPSNATGDSACSKLDSHRGGVLLNVDLALPHQVFLEATTPEPVQHADLVPAGMDVG